MFNERLLSRVLRSIKEPEVVTCREELTTCIKNIFPNVFIESEGSDSDLHITDTLEDFDLSIHKQIAICNNEDTLQSQRIKKYLYENKIQYKTFVTGKYYVIITQ